MKEDLSKGEISAILDKEEKKRRQEAKKRKEEIIALITEETEKKLEYRGKLWGEKSIEAMASEANGGNGQKWSTDTQAEVCFDIDPSVYGIDLDIYAQPMRQMILFEAWDIASKTIMRNWGESGLKLFQAWLDSSVAQICRELDLPAQTTMDFIKKMVRACRIEAGLKGRALIFPFPEEEEEVRSMAHKINRSRAMKRHQENISQPASLENRIYLTPEEKTLGMDTLRQYLEHKGVKVCRSQAARIKNRGWYHGEKYKPSGANMGRKVELSEEDKKMSLSQIVQKYGISLSTASVARRRGFFVINNKNSDNVKFNP